MEAQKTRQIWQAVLGELQLQVTRANYDTWLKETFVVGTEEGTVVVGAPSTFAVEWLENRLHSLVKKTLSTVAGEEMEVRFVVTQDNADAPRSPRQKQRRAATRAKETVEEPAPPELTPSRSTGGVIGKPRLNSRYTFSTFVVGSNNQLAYAAAEAAARSPGQAYNPLFIYGGVGLGKTHLLHAIGHVALQQGALVAYVSSEQFTNDFINAVIRERRGDEFRSRYRSVDLLLVDDVQFIAGKEGTQEEFFHTFNDLHGTNRQIVISSDRPPRSMPLLEDRLRSRFEWGLMADIQPPDFETRVAILRCKAESQETEVPSDVIDFIAHKIQSNVRELEGSLNRVIAQSRLMKMPPTREFAANVLDEVMFSTGRRRILNPQIILQAVARYYSVRLEDLRGSRRHHEVALPRQVAMYLIREETNTSLGEIGQVLGGRDHTTILHGCEKIGKEINANRELRRDIMEIKTALQEKGD
ncbi:MAG: chromosomal replication initiator protein DnaA [Chloroflexota bacterium]|nr:MAG: chromosomal replication initiator protein DnaA [Chloroflexota bacterium]